MKRIIYKTVLLCIFILSVFTLAACGEGSESTEKITLKVYNWGEYISDGSLGSYDTNAEFEKYCREELGLNVEVNYTTYATNEDMYSKLSSGAGSYDIVIPSDYMIQRMIEEDMLLEFNVAEEIENYANIAPEFKNLFYDETNSYSVPYTYGKVGIIYNSTMVDQEDIEDMSWSLMWNEKYSGKILQFNNPRDAMATAMYWKGLDINSTEKADWDSALHYLSEQKPLIQAYVSDEIFNKMISNSASIGAYYAGDFLTMLDSNPDLAFYYPTEGTNIFVDAMCIPKNPNRPEIVTEIAKEYINFMLSEEAAIENAMYIGYASPNTLVYNSEYYIEEMGEEAMDVLYGNSESSYKYDPYYHSFTPELQAYTNGLWEQLKTQNSTEIWVHITSIIIVGSLAGYGIYSIYIKKKRSKDYRLRDKQKKLLNKK